MTWLKPLTHPPLLTHEVHVWQANLDELASQWEILARTLSPDEQTRAKRYHFEIHQHRFAVGRGLLRLLLGQYLAVMPEQIQFEYGTRGKPILSGQTDLYFNVSHSQELILYAFTSGRELGIDIEYLNERTECEQIARRFFSPQEYADLLALPLPQRRWGFFACWTRKEAYIKAIGDGMALPLDQFAVTLHPQQPVALRHTYHAPAEASRWSLYDLPINEHYLAALAVQGQDWQLRCFEYKKQF